MKKYVFSVITLFMGMLVFCSLSFAIDMRELIDRDCIKCHRKVVQNFEKEGGKHQADLDCKECHQVHPSRREGVSVFCGLCHDAGENSHFAISDCSSCHRAHKPGEVDFAAMESPSVACFSCHDELKGKTGAAHGEMSCNECHEQHQGRPACLDCHEPHEAASIGGDCARCHQPHFPMPVRFGDLTDPALCGDCHKGIPERIGGAHKAELSCTDCHGSHNEIPSCSDCHDAGDASHYAQPNCASCHNAHSPQEMDFSALDSPASACFTCHEELKGKTGAAHGEMSCAECHQQHEGRPACLDCHEPHEAASIGEDCSRCHQPHAPMPVLLEGLEDPALCAGCHQGVPESFAVSGGAHQEQLGCADCHGSHGEKPSCSDCHDAGDSAHYALEDCASCHRAHSPKDVDFSALESADDACYSCHGELKEKTGAAHGEMDCLECHQQHQGRPACLDCHEPHEGMRADDCGGCHAPHAPIPVAFGESSGAALCSSCHREEVSEVADRGKAHGSELQCIECHQDHGQIPACADCHDAAESDHFALEDCSSCHNAHRPREVDFSALEGAADACFSCHGELKGKTGAAHGEMDCSECHQQHEGRPACLDCHEPHERMTAGDCKDCHSPHAPSPIAFGGSIRTALCSSCHDDVLERFDAQGEGHEKKLGCYSCHRDHPPAEGSAPAECSKCHKPKSRAHFAIEGCVSCHEPHSPLAKSIEEMENLRPACFSCHGGPKEQIESFPGPHGEMSCDECHQSHGEIPSCLDCHEGHVESMKARDCRSCHLPHAPGRIEHKKEAKADLCAACHEDVAEPFAAEGGAHADEAGCAGCHLGHPPTEGVYPECADCHGRSDKPHYALESCDSCHQPHAPLKKPVSEMEEVRQACLSCHEEPGKDNLESPSSHGAMECNECHQAHGESPSCLECHESHAPSMAPADCQSCHKPHKPTAIAFAADTGAPLCSSCHEEKVAEIAEKGGAHGSEAGCVDCHGEHPDSSCTQCHASHPQKGMGIPDSCASCHAPEENAHFAIGGCDSCHPPHRPLEVDFDAFDPMKPACVSCHGGVWQESVHLPSAHSAMDCKECHQSHGERLECLECHEPHNEAMEYADCLGCHGPHAPTAIAYEADIEPAHCASCHGTEAASIETRGASHRTEVSCASCHPKHKPEEEDRVLSCRTCHPRFKKLHYTAEPCMSCHSPHAPREVNFDGLETVKPACVTCHFQAGRLPKIFPSKHAEFDCRQCHDQHGDSKNCLECHSPHSPGMTYEDCLRCHKPHTPTAIAYKKGEEAAPPELCASCHEEEVEKVAAEGLSHATKVDCLRCHRDHPPYGDETIPACDSCHHPDDDAHFAADRCADCHQAHAPGRLDFAAASPAKEACLPCHGEAQEAFAAAPSAHGELDCSACHLDHGKFQECSSCHEPHSEGMKYGDCLNCHKPHAPMAIVFEGEAPGAFCGACHEDKSAALAADASKHSEMACLDCHQGEHGSAMNCADCHGQPHEPGLHKKFPDCLNCHGDPHDLAEWRTE